MTITIIKLNKYRFRNKIAAFDYDWTLVKPKSNGTFPKNIDDWEWLRPNVPDILKNYYKNGYSIMVFTNQSKFWKIDQIKLVLDTLKIPIIVAIATDKSEYKPNPQMFNDIVSKEWNKSKSFFVGDALGRPNDWSDTDKLFANTIGINIKTPEEIFPFEQKSVSSSNKIKKVNHQEIIILTGYPGSGKSTIAKNIFEPKDYIIINGDELKTSKNMVKKAIPLLKNGKSIVFDATNPTIEKRAEYIQLAKQNNISSRCIYVSTSMDESIARNNLREKDKIVPKIVYYKFRKVFQEPTEKEGCEVIKM
jgi:bifunctional polynucleotide phosphatase/kinase